MLCTKGPFIYTRSYLASQNRLEAQEQKQAPLSFSQYFVLLYDLKKNPEQLNVVIHTRTLWNVRIVLVQHN
jgi:hypothetical protein